MPYGRLCNFYLNNPARGLLLPVIKKEQSHHNKCQAEADVKNIQNNPQKPLQVIHRAAIYGLIHEFDKGLNHTMAHTKQTQKRIRQTEVRNAAHRSLRSSIRTAVKKAEEAIAAGDKKTIPTAFQGAMSALARGAQKGAITAGSASRKVSRLAKRINA